MKRNKCARCGKAERFWRVFESIHHKDVEFFLCVECAQILYKAGDARKDGKPEMERKLRDDFEKGIVDGPLKPILADWLVNGQPSE